MLSVSNLVTRDSWLGWWVWTWTWTCVCTMYSVFDFGDLRIWFLGIAWCSGRLCLIRERNNVVLGIHVSSNVPVCVYVATWGVGFVLRVLDLRVSTRS